jgi:hypothetical protein
VKHPEKEMQAHRKRKYGLTQDQFASLLLDQNNRCAVCGEEFFETPHVDHAHDATKRVRGLLCRKCNALLGQAKDSVDTLLRAVVYLQK